MKRLTLTILTLTAVLLTACQSMARPSIDITVKNENPTLIRETTLCFKKHSFEFGTLNILGEATYLDYPYAIEKKPTLTFKTEKGESKSFIVDLSKVFDGKANGEIKINIQTNCATAIFIQAKQ